MGDGRQITARPWRVPRAMTARRVDWAPGFGTRFTVTVDTEEEFDWTAPFSREARSVTAIAALPAMHARFAARGVAVTYLLDYPVAADPRARDTIARLLRDGVSRVGAQLHPWVNPPHDEAPGAAASFAGNLGEALEAAKLDALTAAIVEGFGARPLTYRAGRYGLGRGTAALLAARGYRLDTSMRAGFDYAGAGGVDYSAVDAHAFHLREGLVELPLTTVFTGALRRRGAALHRLAGRLPRGQGLLARAGLVSRVPLTPEGTPIGEAIRAVDRALADGVRLLTFSFHSPSLVPGHTPYVRDARDLASFHAWWDAMLDALAARGVRAAGEADILAAIR